MRKWKKVFSRQCKTGNIRDIRNYKQTKTRLQKAERKSYWKFADQIIDIGSLDQDYQPKQKRFWSFIKSLRKDTRDIAALKENGKLHADPKDKADILNRQYESTWTRKDYNSIPTPDGTPFPTMPDIRVTAEGVLKLLQKLNPSKATGPDMLPARILKEFAPEVSPLLTIIFQKKFGHKDYPQGLEGC